MHNTQDVVGWLAVIRRVAGLAHPLYTWCARQRVDCPALLTHMQASRELATAENNSSGELFRADGLAHTADIGLWAGPHITQSDVGWLTQHAARCRLARGHLMVGGLARGQLQRVWAGPRALRKRVSQLAACKIDFFR